MQSRLKILVFALLFISQKSFSDPNFSHAIEIQAQSTYSRLKIGLDDAYKPKWKDTKDGFTVSIPGATLMDIGVPFGEEESFQKFLTTLKDSRITQIQVTENNDGLTVKGKYVFPKGAQALAEPQMEHFDFRQNEQNKFVLDFWYKKGLTVAQAAVLAKQARAKKEVDEKDTLLKKEEERRQERAKRMVEAKNALLFCDQPFDRDNTVFLRYRSDHPMLSFNSYFPEHIPDHRFDYTEPKGMTEEADMVRLALKLSRDNKHALVIKTVDFLEKEYPKSRSMNEMQFLKASSFYRLEMEDQGKAVLRVLSKKARGTEAGLQAAAFLAVQAYKRSEWLLALESFLSIRREFPNHPLNWLFHYGVAECMYQIRQYDKAKEEYEWVAKNAPKQNVKAEAAYKVGDLYFERNQFAMAMQSYAKAIQNFGDEVARYPQVYLNLAESYFLLEEYKKAGEMFEKFLEHGRSQPSAWRASLRIAEIKVMNQKVNVESELAFTDTINHYPMTAGATIARLRVLPCGNHGGFDLAGMQRFIDSIDLEEFAGSKTLYLTGFKELIGLTEVRSLLSFNKDEEAIEKGLIHLRHNPSVEVRKLIEKAMIGGIKRLMSKELESNNVFGAIALYEKYGDYLPLPSHDPVADDLRMRLAKFAADRNLKSLALKIIEPYRHLNELGQRELANTLARTLALEGVAEQEERVALEVKSQWNSEDFDIKNQAQADEFFAKVVSLRDQSVYAFERDLLKGLFYADQKDFARANDTAVKIFAQPDFQKLNDAQKAQLYAWAAENAVQDQDDQTALKYFKAARLLSEKSSKSKLTELNYRHLKFAPSAGYLLTSEGETLERMQKWKEAVALYSEAVENKIGGNRVLFAHARVILKEGGRNSKQLASRSLEKIQQSQDDDVWKNLANKKLEQIAKEGVNDSSQQQPR